MLIIINSSTPFFFNSDPKKIYKFFIYFIYLKIVAKYI